VFGAEEEKGVSRRGRVAVHEVAVGTPTSPAVLEFFSIELRWPFNTPCIMHSICVSTFTICSLLSLSENTTRIVKSNNKTRKKKVKPILHAVFSPISLSMV